MQLMPQGDHYIWYCEWCDTRNVTLWIRVERDEVCCAACHKRFPVMGEARQGAGTKKRGYYQVL